MPFTEDFILPTEEELTVQEIHLSSPALRAGAQHFGKYCDEQSKEFMLCRAEEKDPRKCLKEGRAVTSCALDFFQNVKQLCRQEFDEYSHCLEWSSYSMEMSKCRKTQSAYDMCMLEKMGVERPPMGYFSRARSHHTCRPKPEPKNHREYPDKAPGLPDDYPREPAKYGSRFYFFA